MNVDNARLIWGDDLTHDELVKWVKDVNSRAADDPSVHRDPRLSFMTRGKHCAQIRPYPRGRAVRRESWSGRGSPSGRRRPGRWRARGTSSRHTDASPLFVFVVRKGYRRRRQDIDFLSSTLINAASFESRPFSTE
jgi:hypothetical protein